MKEPLDSGLHFVLSVTPNEEDCASLERILKSGWFVIACSTVASALAALRERPIPVVIYDCDISSGSWIGMLNRISPLPAPPLFIVTSRPGDECLWAEALSLGAWDVLAKPFDTDEVIRIVGIACRHWQDRHGGYINRTKQKKSANGTGSAAASGT